MHRIKRGLMLGVFLLAASASSAVERTLRLESPATIRAGQTQLVSIIASTDAGKGEHVGFLQAELSLDDGKTWLAVCYLQKSGAKVVHPVHVPPSAAGTVVRLRARAAFRGGPAGDVDVSGAAILWDTTWGSWQSPPAKNARIDVK